MTVLVLTLVGLGLLVAAAAVVGHLRRIADAIEAQNRAYGVDTQTKSIPVPKKAA